MKPQLKQTKNYSQFTIDSANRDIQNVNKLVASMQAYGFLPSHPLHVVLRRGKMVLVDGQHRLEAARRVGTHVFYVVCEDEKVSIPYINSAQRPWTAKDYVRSYSVQGNTDYLELFDFVERHKMPVNIAACLLGGRQRSGHQNSSLRDGGFKVRNRRLAESIARIVDVTSGYVKWAKNSLYIDALSRCAALPEFDPEHYVKKIIAMPGNLELQPTRSAFLGLIEKIYNYKNRQPVPLKYLVEIAADKRDQIKSKPAA